MKQDQLNDHEKQVLRQTGAGFSLAQRAMLQNPLEEALQVVWENGYSRPRAEALNLARQFGESLIDAFFALAKDGQGAAAGYLVVEAQKIGGNADGFVETLKSSPALSENEVAKISEAYRFVVEACQLLADSTGALGSALPGRPTAGIDASDLSGSARAELARFRVLAAHDREYAKVEFGLPALSYYAASELEAAGLMTIDTDPEGNTMMYPTEIGRQMLKPLPPTAPAVSEAASAMTNEDRARTLEIASLAGHIGGERYSNCSLTMSCTAHPHEYAYGRKVGHGTLCLTQTWKLSKGKEVVYDYFLKPNAELVMAFEKKCLIPPEEATPRALNAIASAAEFLKEYLDDPAAIEALREAKRRRDEYYDPWEGAFPDDEHNVGYDDGYDEYTE